MCKLSHQKGEGGFKTPGPGDTRTGKPQGWEVPGAGRHQGWETPELGDSRAGRHHDEEELEGGRGT